MSDIAVITTFPNHMWDVYARDMLQSYVRYWPRDITLMIQLDDDLLLQDVNRVVRPGVDAIAPGWEPDHAAFVERNKGRDHPTDYRMQAIRFCHKVFAIKRACDAIMAAKANNEPTARYLIWMDADVITTHPVSMDEIRACLPKEGDAVAYLGRKDWDHSECGWLAFALDNGGELVIQHVVDAYITDGVFNMQQIHDSWVWDQARAAPMDKTYRAWTNLTPNATGREVWHQSPMGAWSTHYKGPEAKAKLAQGKQPQHSRPIPTGNIQIQTRNAIPHEEIRAQIEKNQKLIKHWIQPCKPHDEEIVVVSAGPMLVAEDVRKEVAAGKKIVAVKHALEPLKKAGIKPWASILLDPRPHVAKFVEDADPDILWFVASQVNPQVTLNLLARGCTVFGYHASVGAGEDYLTEKQIGAVVAGGSATATRGLYMLGHLGFSHMKLYGYDLSVPDKPDLDAKDEQGQPKYLEISIGINDPLYNVKRIFYAEPQLIAQFEELNDIIKGSRFKLRAEGDGIVPFMIRSKEIADMRRKEFNEKIAGPNPPYYMDMLGAA